MTSASEDVNKSLAGKESQVKRNLMELSGDGAAPIDGLHLLRVIARLERIRIIRVLQTEERPVEGVIL